MSGDLNYYSEINFKVARGLCLRDYYREETEFTNAIDRAERIL